MTPASLPGGPVTDFGGQKALNPSISVVAANECEVSVSERIATSTLLLQNVRRINGINTGYADGDIQTLFTYFFFKKLTFL